MLEKLLSEIQARSTQSISELAVKLNTTPAMVQAMLAHLEKLNMIRQYRSCGDSCSGCSIKDRCNIDQRSAGLYFYEETHEI